MVFLFTDFGADGPYLGQMKGAMKIIAPAVELIDLVSNAPAGDPESGSYLLAALTPFLPAPCVVLAVVDPGVGGPREPVVCLADGRWFVGPDNGLFNSVAVRAEAAEWSTIDWRPDQLSASFHGRDLFAPIAARIAKRDLTFASHSRPSPDLSTWPIDLDRIIFFDTYGNAYTGRRYDAHLAGKRLVVGQFSLSEAGTFSEVPKGTAFWYRNSVDLIEIAVNGGSARKELELEIGMAVRFAF